MNRLKALREKRGWSKAELARRAGLHASTVGLIESERLRPYPSQVKRLAAALGVDQDALSKPRAGSRVKEESSHEGWRDPKDAA